MGQSRPLFVFIFVLFSLQFQYKLKKHRWCAWDSNRRMVGADETTELWRLPINFMCSINLAFQNWSELNMFRLKIRFSTRLKTRLFCKTFSFTEGAKSHSNETWGPASIPCLPLPFFRKNNKFWLKWQLRRNETEILAVNLSNEINRN